MITNDYMTIDGLRIPINGEKNVLEVIRKANIELPTFCYHSELSVYGACRLCVAEIDGAGIQASCSIAPKAGMVVRTNTAEVRQIRKINLELLLANHDISCPTCVRSNNCKLQELASQIGIQKSRFKKINAPQPIDSRSPSIVHDPNKCVLCGDCVRACKEVQSVGAIDFVRRGSQTAVAPAFGKSLADVECVNCGQCVSVCPVGALTPKSEIQQVWDNIFDGKKVVVAQVAPAVRVSIGEQFGKETGTISTGQIVAALKRVGFNYVYDTSFAADLTILEEATEFIQRKTKGEKLPQFTSCCPAWVKFIEQYYPQLLPNLSSCKSPQQMFGSLAKNMLPEMLGVAPENLVVVSIMPCTAKKFEAKREEFIHDGNAEVDHVLTTTELARMISESGLQFNKLSPESFDLPLGFKTGAGVIFGNSGGVSEAVLRYAYEKISGNTLMNCDFTEVRGLEGIRSATVKIDDTELKIGIVHSLKNAREICESIIAGQCEFDFIEVMACPGGCIVGGGQPVNFEHDFKMKRARSLYECDKQLQLHKPQENPYVKELYVKTFDGIGGSVAHKLLHTKYHGRKRISDQTIAIRNTGGHKIEICVCVGTNCFLKGSQELLKQLMNYVTFEKWDDLVNVKTIDDDSIDVKATFCFERCNKGPIAKVNNTIIEQATFEKVKTVLFKEIERVQLIMENS